MGREGMAGRLARYWSGRLACRNIMPRLRSPAERAEIFDGRPRKRCRAAEMPSAWPAGYGPRAPIVAEIVSDAEKLSLPR